MKKLNKRDNTRIMLRILKLRCGLKITKLRKKTKTNISLGCKNTKRIIRDWEELKQIPNESETHILEVGECNAWLYAKNERKYNEKIDYLKQVQHLDVYLSTHTFYGKNYQHNTKILQACGFDVELANWDEK